MYNKKIYIKNKQTNKTNNKQKQKKQKNRNKRKQTKNKEQNLGLNKHDFKRFKLVIKKIHNFENDFITV